MPTLSQQLGSFPSETRAEIFFHCRQDCPLPPPINRGGFYCLREEKIKSKNRKKPASPCFHFPSFPVSLLQLSPPLHSCLLRQGYQQTQPIHHHEHQLHHRKPAQPLSSHRDSLSLLLPAFFSPLQTSSSCAVATPQAKLSINADTCLSTSTTTGPYRLRWFSIPALHQPPAPIAHCCFRCMQNSFCMQRPK